MKKTISVQARRCCWLPLVAMCIALPVQADQMIVTVNTPLAAPNSPESLTGRQFVITGFNASLGTLTEVEVSYEIDGNFTITHGNSGDFVDFSGGLGSEAPVILELGGLFRANPTGKFDFKGSRNFSSPADLAAFGSSSDWDPSASVSLEALPADATFASSDDEAKLTVTYDYTPVVVSTPVVASTPEPASLFLLGTIAACAWAIGKRRQGLKKQGAN